MEERDGAGHAAPHVLGGVPAGLLHPTLGGQVQDGLGSKAGQRPGGRLRARVGLQELNLAGERVTAGVAPIVDHQHPAALGDQPLDSV